MKIKNNHRGIVFLGVLMFFVVLFGLSAIFALRAVNEANRSRIEREEAAAFYAAQGGAEAGLVDMNTLINSYLLNTIGATNPSTVVNSANSHVANGDGVDWLWNAVMYNNAQVLTKNGEQAEYSKTAALGNAAYEYKIVITEKSDPVTAGTTAWDFPYMYRIEANGSYGDASKDVYLSGDFTVRVQKDNFAKYALFTNTQNMESGTPVWFTSNSIFNGPIHTNDRFNFAKNPSGTFYNDISQVQTTARFYNNGDPFTADADVNGTIDVPTYQGTFTRGAASVTLSSPTTQTSVADQARGGTTISSDGIYTPNNGTALTGGIYVKGNGTLTMSVQGNKPVYTVTQGGVTKQITVNPAANQTTVEIIAGGSGSDTYDGLPDGVDNAGTIIHVDGGLTGFNGTVESNSEVTVSVKNDIVINNHVRYESYTPGSGTLGQPGYVAPTADGSTNLLGLVSWQGDVRVGTAAPNNVDIHGTVLAQTGVFKVDNYNNQGVGPRGTATLLGGAITDKYGAFFLFNGTTGQQLSGYARNFVYDQRMLVGNAPPYFPSLNTFIAFTNDLKDKLVWQEAK